jgi:hypothetical protein
VDRRTLLRGGSVMLGAAAGGLLGGCSTQKPPRPSEQQHGHRLFGISLTGALPQSVEIAESVGAALNRQPQVLNFFAAWEWRAPFPEDTVKAIREANAIPEITWEPWDPRAGPVQPAYELAHLDAYDSYVDDFARGCAEYGDTIMLRFAH